MDKHEKQARATVQAMGELDPEVMLYMTPDKIERMARVLSRKPTIYRKGISRTPMSAAMFANMTTGARRVPTLREMETGKERT